MDLHEPPVFLDTDNTLFRILDDYDYTDYLSESNDDFHSLSPSMFKRGIIELKAVIAQQAYLVRRREYLEALLKLA